MSGEGMDGWEATPLLKRGDVTRHIPIIVLSAHVMPSDRAQALEAGGDDLCAGRRRRSAGDEARHRRLGHNLGMDVVAEGVETEAQLAALRSLSCEFCQGFLFSRPVDARDATRLIASQPMLASL